MNDGYVKFKSGENDMEFYIGKDPEETAELFGTEVCWLHAIRSIKQQVQSHVGAAFKASRSLEDVEATLRSWVPADPRRRKMTEQERAMKIYNSLTPEQKESFNTLIAAVAPKAKGPKVGGRIDASDHLDRPSGKAFPGEK